MSSKIEHEKTSASKAVYQTENVDILMYHSISNGAGPTCISPELFRNQMDALADTGAEVMSLDEFARWHSQANTRKKNASRRVVLTFDDGFTDFADAAFPVLKAKGWPATVFLPTAHIGKTENWRGAANPPRRLMDWPLIRDLAHNGITFGSHSLTHPDLTALDQKNLHQELHDSKSVIEDKIGKPAAHFAPPYGRADTHTVAEISKLYQTSCGTELGRANRQSNLHNLPRIEMFYFKNPKRWQTFLSEHPGTYLKRRQFLRALRAVVSKPWEHHQ